MPLRSHSVDPRAERVRNRLRVAAFALAQERPVDHITVGDLVTRADVSRQVFYRHFRDRDDAVAAAITHAFTEAVAQDPGSEPRAQILRVFDFAAEHHAMYRNVVPSTVTRHVVNTFREALLPACQQIAATGTARLSTAGAVGAPPAPESVARFLVGGFMEVLRSWMEDPDGTDLTGRVNAALDTVDALLGQSTRQRGPHHG